MAAVGAIALAAVPGPAFAQDPFALTQRSASVAHVVFPTHAYARPGKGPRVAAVGTSATWGGGPVGLMVLRSAEDDRNRTWLKVRLPQRPNRAAGWIRADLARVSRTPWRVVVSTRAREIRLLHRGRVVSRFPAVVGAPSTPTPHGLFAVSERIRQSGGVLGPWALHLTAHSSVLRNYGGGPGRVAIHGRSGSLLTDPLGSARSHGCVRVANSRISRLARVAREGTPVLIRP